MLARVALDVVGEPDAPTSVVATFPSEAAANPELADSLGFYETELDFYDRIGASSGMPGPACYAALRGESTDQFVLILEDLGNLRAADQVAGLDRDDLPLAWRATAAAVITVGGVDLGNERGEALGAAFLDRFIAAYDDHDLGSIITRY